MNKLFTFFICIISMSGIAKGITIGSNSSFSRQSHIVFPTADSDNELRGFAAFDNGFSLENKSTTCLFSNFNKVSGPVALNGGTLSLMNDFVFTSSFAFDWSGTLEGNGHCFGLPLSSNNLALNNGNDLGSPTIDFVASAATSAQPISIDWSYDSQYISSGELRTTQDLEVFYFDGVSVTNTAFLNRNGYVYTTRWHPKDHYLAFSDVYGGTDEINVYKFNTSNGLLEAKDTRDLGSSVVFASAWHPSGDFLAMGGNSTNQEISMYSFSSTTELLTDMNHINITPNRLVYLDSMDWSHHGDLLSVGTSPNNSSGVPELLIYSFDGSDLTLTSSAETGRYVFSTDWSPTGTFVAVGLYLDAFNIRVYEYSAAGQSISEVMTARQAETKRAYSVHWHPTGDYLLVGLGNGSSSEVRVYSFDKQAKTLSLFHSIPVSNYVLTARWSPNGEYFAFGDYTRRVSVYSFSQGGGGLVLDSVVLDLNSNLDVFGNLLLQGECKVRGNGNTLTIKNGGSCSIGAGSHVVFEDIEIDPGENGLYCLTNDVDIVVRNSIINLSTHYTFSQGSLLFDEDVLITGFGNFSYEATRSSTISDNSSLFIDKNVTLKYAPSRDRSDLLYFDENSLLYFDGSSLISTSTALHFSQGCIVFDDQVTVSSQAQSNGEALIIGSDVDVKVLSNADVQIYGYCKYGT